MIVIIPGGKRIVGRVIALSLLGPGRANVTIETVDVLPRGEYAAIYKAASRERPPVDRGIFKVFNSVAYGNRWRASGILTPPRTRNWLLIPPRP
jgi:hypothetical protein